MVHVITLNIYRSSILKRFYFVPKELKYFRESFRKLVSFFPKHNDSQTE